MLFFRDFSCGFRVPSTCRDPQGEMMCLRSAKIAATNDRCPSCPPRHFPLFASPESDCVHLPKSLSLLRTVFLRHTPPPTGSCRGAIGHTIFLSKSAFSIFARQSSISSPILLQYARRLRNAKNSNPAQPHAFGGVTGNGFTSREGREGRKVFEAEPRQTRNGFAVTKGHERL